MSGLQAVILHYVNVYIRYFNLFYFVTTKTTTTVPTVFIQFLYICIYVYMYICIYIYIYIIFKQIQLIVCITACDSTFVVVSNN